MNELSILSAAGEAPEHDCLVVGGRALSFADVARRVGGAILSLRARGVEVGQRVAVAPQIDLDSVVWLYALFELGCPAVLLHPRLTEGEREQALRAARPVHAIDEPAPPACEVSADDMRGVLPSERTLAVVYTSGTSGRARGAQLSRRAFVASEAAHAANLGWQPQDRWLLSMPLAHVGGLSILTRCLIARRCAVLSPGPFDAPAAIETMTRDRVTLASVVPTMLRRLLLSEGPRWLPSSELRAVLVGGAPFPESLRALAAERGIAAFATYGCTEACSQVTTQTPEQLGTSGCGSPLPGIEVRIDDGEIQIRGEVLMTGYLEGDAPRRITFTEDGWLRTGDTGDWLADGQLMVRGRIDDTIVTGGENVAPQEIEAWLENVPGIDAACVFSVPDEEWGQQVVAAVVTRRSSLDLADLRDRMRRNLAPHKRPKRICLVESLPLNRSGKPDRMAVARDCRSGLRPI